MEHAISLEAFLDTSIVAGFSYGVDKAQVAVIAGKLLGHMVSRSGASAESDRVQAIVEFAPLKEPSHVRQFVGCTNWIRWYLASYYATAVKILAEYMRPEAKFPAIGLGAEGEKSEGSKVVRAIKIMAAHCIETAVMDEAAAIDGSRPLEQIADACGYAWGSTDVQMTHDLTRFKVLLMAGKGLTPAQQAWPALTLEAYAQLMGKRVQKKVLGPMRTINWTDHANLTKQQTCDPAEIEVKHLRWVSEVIADGSEIRSAQPGSGTELREIPGPEMSWWLKGRKI